MTVISGNIQDIGYQPLSGKLTATSVDFRSENGALVAPETHEWPINAGNVAATLLPGPARLTITVGTHAHDTWDVIVPDTDVTLATLIDDSIEWAPPIVSIVGEHRRAAEAAAARAEQAATEADGSASAAAGSASAASSSASDAADSATAAGSSATAAAGSAGDAAGSATAAAGSASAAAGSATTASQGAQVITDNLAAIEAAPGHAVAAQSARTGAEDARDAASGSATDAADSASGAAGSATAAGAARDGAVTARSGAESARDAAAGSATAAGSARDQAVSARDAAAGHAGSASSHASAAAGSAAAASGSETVASQKASAAAVSASDAASALAQVLVELSNTQAYQDVVTAIGDMSSSWNADIQAALADLIGQAPETLDSIQEIATALGNDPNFYTTVMTAIGERVKNDDPRLTNARTPTAHTHSMSEVDGLDDALDGKSGVGHSHTWDQIGQKPGTFPSTIALVAGLQAALDGKAATGHTHTKAQVGLGNVDNTSDAAKPVSTAVQAALTPLQARMSAAPATWRWNGTSLPTAASQVHAQARAGDFIVAPNLTTDPGWHQITGV